MWKKIVQRIPYTKLSPEDDLIGLIDLIELELGLSTGQKSVRTRLSEIASELSASKSRKFEKQHQLCENKHVSAVPVDGKGVAHMATWLLILLSAIGGLLIVGAALAAAFWPEMRARPKKSWMADPSGNVDDHRYN